MVKKRIKIKNNGQATKTRGFRKSGFALPLYQMSRELGCLKFLREDNRLPIFISNKGRWYMIIYNYWVLGLGVIILHKYFT